MHNYKMYFFRLFALWITMWQTFRFKTELYYFVSCVCTFCIILFFCRAKRKQDSFVSIPLSFCLSSVNIIKGICLSNVVRHLEDSADRQNFLVACIGNNNTGPGIGCVNDLSSADIKRHMSGITDQVSRLCIG